MDQIKKKYGAFILLRISVQDTLKQHYATYVEEYNKNLLMSIENSFHHVNDGFDLITPETQECAPGEIAKVNFGVKIEATYISEKIFPCGMKLYARSSIYKTPLRLANAVGVIDPGYRGDIQGMFDCSSNYTLMKDSRIVQLCASSEFPIFVELVENLTDTSRGDKGFGSSG